MTEQRAPAPSGVRGPTHGGVLGGVRVADAMKMSQTVLSRDRMRRITGPDHHNEGPIMTRDLPPHAGWGDPSMRAIPDAVWTAGSVPSDKVRLTEGARD